jgi:hypothetical protein
MISPLPRKLSGRTPVQVRRDLRLEVQACLFACRLKLSILRVHFDCIPGPREWPAIPDFPKSVARGHALDSEVVQLMALAAAGYADQISDPLWRQRALDLYRRDVETSERTSA